MRDHDHDHDATTRAAWDAFARADRATTVPPGLDARVRAAVTARRNDRPAARGGKALAWGLGLGTAATLAVAVQGLLPRADVIGARRTDAAARGAAVAAQENVPGSAGLPGLTAPGAVAPGTPAVETDAGEPVRRGPPQAVAVRGAGRASRVPQNAVSARGTTAHGEDVRARTVVADDRLGADTEPLQIVRVRIPSSSLPALGVRVSPPSMIDGPALVDVDLVVGFDGWPREIRDIRQVRAADVQP